MDLTAGRQAGRQTGKQVDKVQIANYLDFKFPEILHRLKYVFKLLLLVLLQYYQSFTCRGKTGSEEALHNWSGQI